MDSSQLPIGVFDSGLGGLTVLDSLVSHFPNESFIYLGDTARLPYGSKSPETIHKYLHRNINFLTQKKVKAIVVACNSASSVLDMDSFEGAPIYGVIQPGARLAEAMSEKKRIGVLGTRATISQQSYVKALRHINPKATIYQQACPLFVPLVEEGWIDDPLTNLVVYRYLSPLLAVGVDAIVLGCTHYPLLRPAIAKVSGPNVALVDSAEAIAEQLRMDFEEGRIQPAQQKTLENLFLVTDYNEHYQETTTRLVSSLKITNWQVVDI